MRFIKRWSVSKMNQEESRETLGVSHDSPPFWKPRGAWGRVYGLQLTRQHDSAYGLPWRKAQWEKNETMLAHFCQCDGPIHWSLTRFVLPLSAEWFCPVCLEVRGNMEVRTPNKRKTVISILYKLYNDILFFFSMVSSKGVRVGPFFRKAPYSSEFIYNPFVIC